MVDGRLDKGGEKGDHVCAERFGPIVFARILIKLSRSTASLSGVCGRGIQDQSIRRAAIAMSSYRGVV